MAEISEVAMEETQPESSTINNAVESRSQERLADADEIEAALANITRPSAQLHLQNLITKLRKEGKALQRVAASSSTAAAAEPVASSPPAPSAALAAPSIPQKSPVITPIQTSTTTKYHSFPTHYFDVGSYNSPLVTIYIPLDNIGSHDKSKISCQFTTTSFDLIVSDFEDGKSYRLVNDNLEKEIDVSKCKYIVKPNKIIIKLGKVKGEYSYDHWTELTAKKKKKDAKKKDDPTAGIMDLMKDMYDSGDDNMRKMIGETMLKQRTGQLGKDGGMGGMMGGMDDLGMGDMGL